MERAKSDPHVRFNSLAHLLDEAALKRAFRSISRKAAAGLDGITKGQYGQKLDDNIRDLHDRMRSMQYRHQPIRRVHIPKGHDANKTRPIGISCIEDKIVQGALCEVLGVHSMSSTWRRSRMVEISKYGSERARVGDCPGYSS